jgi:hypothetical protein
MIPVQAYYRYEGPLGKREATCLDEIRNLYGIWRLRHQENNRKIIVDYDGTRLNRNDIAIMLQNAGISLANPHQYIASMAAAAHMNRARE